MGTKFQLGGKYPAINWTQLEGVFNRTLSFRRDADVTVSHGYFEKIPPGQVTDLPPTPQWSQKFSNYTKHNFNNTRNSKESRSLTPLTRSYNVQLRNEEIEIVFMCLHVHYCREYFMCHCVMTSCLVFLSMLMGDGVFYDLVKSIFPTFQNLQIF